MLRSIGLAGFGLAILSAPPAQALEASYCGGRIVAERFATRVVPGPGGRASYSVLLRNTQERSQDFRLVVTGSFIGRPAPATQTLLAGGSRTVALGYTPNMPGVAPMRGDQIAQMTRLACL
ncbi:hypothetical protein [Roseococcus pinisoli]|uniref:Uncharacterized protein n=1 Tax=Roseococcus pinisoli TaxID=2835040 RepID=A0ABS5QCS4_9PROT|nr:hypothetical protein [Roseococcus pinisoli]MBS7811299.1 hypothetical protein [Roseococcus pinisoli]